MNFETYLKEEISEEDKKKIRDYGYKMAKKIYGDKYDEKKAEKMINDLISKHSDKEASDITQIVANAFKSY